MKTWVLVDKDGNEVTLPAKRKTFRGEEHTITSGSPPHKPGSTGRVYVEGGGQYFPNVFDLRWEER